jgi:hypothetical protein
MKRKLLIAALAMVGGCDHHFGIGALEPDAGVAISGQEAGASTIDHHRLPQWAAKTRRRLRLAAWTRRASSSGRHRRTLNLFPGEPWVGRF